MALIPIVALTHRRHQPVGAADEAATAAAGRELGAAYDDTISQHFYHSLLSLAGRNALLHVTLRKATPASTLS